MMKKLPQSTIQLISSSQVITSVSSAVKELVENSIDAGATNIEVRLKNYGLEKIEVSDNGCGIKSGEEEFVAKAHYTSKLKDHNDLAQLSTFGFRGEAIHSLCNISDFSFSTKTKDQTTGMMYTLDHNGAITLSRTCARGDGTTMTADNIFKNLPVRKQFYSGVKKLKEELKKVEDVLISYCLMMPELRIHFKHNGSIVWQKTNTTNLKDCFISIFGVSCFSQMQIGSFIDESKEIEISYVLPKAESNDCICRRSSDRVYIHVNQRPVQIKSICQIVKSLCCEYVAVLQNRYPIAFISLTIPKSRVDVNIEPNKTNVLLENMDEIEELVYDVIQSFYRNQLKGNDAMEVSAADRGDCNAADLSKNEIILNMNSSHKKSPRNRPLLYKSRISDVETSPQLLNNPETPEIANESHLTACERNRASEELPAKITRIDFDIELTKAGNDDDLAQEKTPRTLELPEQSTDFDGLVDREDGPQNQSQEVDISKQRLISNAMLLERQQDSNQRAAESFSICKGIGKEPKQLAKEEIMEMNDKNDARLITNNAKLSKLGAEVSSSCSLFSQETTESDKNKNCSQNSLTEKYGLKVDANEAVSDSNTSKDTGRCIEQNPGNIQIMDDDSLDELFHEEGEFVFDEPARDNGKENDFSKGINLSQMRIDSWSKGTALTDKDSGNPLQPTEVLQPPQSKVPSTKKKSKKFSALASTKAELILSKSPHVWNRNHLLETVLHFSVQDLVASLDSQETTANLARQPPNEEISVIGKITPWTSWIIRKDAKMYFFNPYRAREIAIFQQLMKKHVLQMEALQRPIFIDLSMIGDYDYWKVLQNLQFQNISAETGRYVLDARLSSNGFMVRQRKANESGEILFEITQMSSQIQDYGISELKEILEKISEHSLKESNEEPHLENYRPKKLEEFLKAEAIRLARIRSYSFSKDEIQELVEDVFSQSPSLSTCLHDKTIVHPIN